jgi:hypothetical protein
MESLKIINICEGIIALDSEKHAIVENITSGKEKPIKNNGVMLVIDRNETAADEWPL